MLVVHFLHYLQKNKKKYNKNSTPVQVVHEKVVDPSTKKSIPNMKLVAKTFKKLIARPSIPPKYPFAPKKKIDITVRKIIRYLKKYVWFAKHFYVYIYI